MKHNRVHDGRQMRVQLRDCNPPHRGNWKFGRGRGRFNQPALPRRYGGPDDDETDAVDRQRQETDPQDRFEDAPSPNRTDVPPVPVFPLLSCEKKPTSESGHRHPKSTSKRVEGIPTGEVRARDGSTEESCSPSRKSSPGGSPTTGEESSQFETYREWYDEPVSAAATGPPSSFGSSASATPPTAVTYPMPNGGYYPPNPWMQPFPQQMPYTMPYFPGYPGAAIPSQQGAQPFVSPVGSDASGPAVGTQNAWPQMGGSMFSVRIITGFSCFVVESYSLPSRPF